LLRSLLRHRASKLLEPCKVAFQADFSPQQHPWSSALIGKNPLQGFYAIDVYRCCCIWARTMPSLNMQYTIGN
jgi:hypothetical protein